MLKIVSFTICPFVQRITALLAAKDIPYDIEYINLNNKPLWFLERSPNGQVPLLITENGDNLFESDAIAEYIDEISAPLEADLTPEQRAQNRAWSYQGTKQYLAQCSAQRAKTKDLLLERRSHLSRALSNVEMALGDSPYFNGTTLGNVDIAWLPLLHRAFLIEKHTNYDFLEEHPKVKQWQATLLDTGLAEKSVSEDFEQKFTDFYLSNETYLGNTETLSKVARCNRSNNHNSCC